MSTVYNPLPTRVSHTSREPEAISMADLREGYSNFIMNRAVTHRYGLRPGDFSQEDGTTGECTVRTKHGVPLKTVSWRQQQPSGEWVSGGSAQFLVKDMNTGNLRVSEIIWGKGPDGTGYELYDGTQIRRIKTVPGGGTAVVPVVLDDISLWRLKAPKKDWTNQTVRPYSVVDSEGIRHSGIVYKSDAKGNEVTEDEENKVVRQWHDFRRGNDGGDGGEIVTVIEHMGDYEDCVEVPKGVVEQVKGMTTDGFCSIE